MGTHLSPGRTGGKDPLPPPPLLPPLPPPPLLLLLLLLLPLRLSQPMPRRGILGEAGVCVEDDFGRPVVRTGVGRPLVIEG